MNRKTEEQEAIEVLARRHAPVVRELDVWRGLSALKIAIIHFRNDNWPATAASLAKVLRALEAIGKADILESMQAEYDLLPQTRTAIRMLHEGGTVDDVAAYLGQWDDGPIASELWREVCHRLPQGIDAALKLDEQIATAASRSQFRPENALNHLPCHQMYASPHSPQRLACIR